MFDSSGLECDDQRHIISFRINNRKTSLATAYEDNEYDDGNALTVFEIDAVAALLAHSFNNVELVNLFESVGVPAARVVPPPSDYLAARAGLRELINGRRPGGLGRLFAEARRQRPDNRRFIELSARFPERPSLDSSKRINGSAVPLTPAQEQVCRDAINRLLQIPVGDSVTVNIATLATGISAWTRALREILSIDWAGNVRQMESQLSPDDERLRSAQAKKMAIEFVDVKSIIGITKAIDKAVGLLQAEMVHFERRAAVRQSAISPADLTSLQTISLILATLTSIDGHDRGALQSGELLDVVRTFTELAPAGHATPDGRYSTEPIPLPVDLYSDAVSQMEDVARDIQPAVDIANAIANFRGSSTNLRAFLNGPLQLP